MARIITINRLKHNNNYTLKVGALDWIPDNRTHSINLETVRTLSCVPVPNYMKVETGRHGFWAILFGDVYEIVESGTHYSLRFKYKNYRHGEDLFQISPEEYERLKPELAKYGWHI